MTITIRPPGPTDRPAWEALYQGYAQFYGVPQTAQMRARVWDWLMDPAHEVQGRVAVLPDGRLAGLAHFRPFARPLSASTGGFLDDLFVDPQARGAGVATALIEALTVEARARGWSVLRWITAQDNDTAMSVYNRVADRTAWVTYDLKP
jgi:GNAT superfamily N-acetyltransferase